MDGMTFDKSFLQGRLFLDTAADQTNALIRHDRKN